MHFVYILYSIKLKKFYVGYSLNVMERLDYHNASRSPFTSSGIPWKLIYYSAFTEKEDAMSEERFLKSGQGRQRRKFLLKCFLSKL